MLANGQPKLRSHQRKSPDCAGMVMIEHAAPLGKSVPVHLPVSGAKKTAPASKAERREARLGAAQ
jgi:hypothetical protein